jgi:hypothetical protein
MEDNDKPSLYTRILEDEFGKSIVTECKGDICVSKMILLDITLVARFGDEYLTLEAEEPPASSDPKLLSTIPMVRLVYREDDHPKITCDLPVECLSSRKALESCISSVISGVFALNHDLTRRILRNIIDLVGSLASQGLTGNEIFRVLVEDYRVPRDLAEASIESYQDVSRDD